MVYFFSRMKGGIFMKKTKNIAYENLDSAHKLNLYLPDVSSLMKPHRFITVPSLRLRWRQFSKYLLQPSSKVSATPLAILIFFTLKILL